MSRHLLQRLVVWTAFAVALLIPLSARAAILPLCEVDAMTMMPRAPVTPPPSTALPLAFAAAEELASPCDERAAANDDDDAVDPKIAAFCDARGASAIAPQRILPINDARIEAPSSCARLDTSTQTISSSPRDGLTAGSAALLLDPAALDASAMVHPASSSLLPAFAPVTGAEHAGALRSIYHPPR